LLLRTRRRPVLFVREGALGDIVCTFPAALELKKRHPGAAFIYSCHRDFSLLPVMAGITTHTTSVHMVRESWWRFLFAEVYHFRYGDEIGGGFCTQTLIEEFCTQHSVPVTDIHPQLRPSSPALSQARSLLSRLQFSEGPLVAFHLGPSWPVREWPHGSWVALTKELQARGIRNIIRLGVDRHVQLGTSPSVDIPGTISLVNQLTVEETTALISLVDLFVGIDSGLLHIAASTRSPAVGIFGATSPQFRFAKASSIQFVVSRVKCQGCHHRLPRLHWQTGCPYDIECMKIIPVSEVFQACLSKLQATKAVSASKV
jgi:ADP-heptose:LPS heptosyltransferase